MTETKMPPTYNELVERRVVLKDEINDLKARFKQDLRVLEGKLEPLERAVAVAEHPHGISVVQFQLARAILILDWGRDSQGRRRTDREIQPVIETAIGHLRLGGSILRRTYVGLKQYDRWSAQEVQCEYGYGPSHGSVWFRIGMMEQYRRRPEPLQEYEKVACIQWLNAVRERPDLLDVAGL